MVDRERSQRGQATVELVALLPAMVVLALVAWWLVAAAATWVQAGAAANVAARAASVGEDHVAAAERVAPGARVSRDPSDLRITITTPRVLGLTPRIPITATPSRDEP